MVALEPTRHQRRRHVVDTILTTVRREEKQEEKRMGKTANASNALKIQEDLGIFQPMLQS